MNMSILFSLLRMHHCFSTSMIRRAHRFPDRILVLGHYGAHSQSTILIVIESPPGRLTFLTEQDRARYSSIRIPGMMGLEDLFYLL